MVTLRLEWMDETGALRSFVTQDALWDGADWNGFPAPQLPKWQDWLLKQLIGEDPGPVPSTQTEAEGVEESDYVWCDGLTWSVIDAEVLAAMWHVDVDVVDLDALRHNLPSNMLIEVLHNPGPCGHPEVRLHSRFRSLLDVFLVQHGYDLDAHEIAED